MLRLKKLEAKVRKKDTELVELLEIYEQAQTVINKLKPFVNPYRIVLLSILYKEGELTYTDFLEKAARHHYLRSCYVVTTHSVHEYLGPLKKAGYIKIRRDPPNSYYSLDVENLEEVKALVEHFYKEITPSLTLPLH